MYKEFSALYHTYGLIQEREREVGGGGITKNHQPKYTDTDRLYCNTTQPAILTVKSYNPN